jgi:polysaccharide biosynthesis/export protein
LKAFISGTILPLFLVLALAGCVKPTKFDPAQISAATVSDSLTVPSSADRLATAREYRLGPTDKLSVQILGVQELERTVQIDSSGAVTLPLIGAIPAAGETTNSLAGKIAEAYSERYLQNPQVTVSLTEAISQQVLVDGAVTNPGQYQVTGGSTLMAAIANARGVTDTAKLDQILLFRTTNGQRMVARFNLADIRGGRAVDPPVFANDAIIVGSGTGRLGVRDLLLLTPVVGAFAVLIR